MKKNVKKMDCWLDVKGVSKTYDKIVALNDVSFSANKGEIIALLGPNGAGKSTLMNIISGYLAPSNGSVCIKGVDVAVNDIATKKEIGFLSEGSPLYSDMSVKRFLQYFIELKLSIDENSAQQIKKVYQDELDRIVKIANIGDVLEQKIETLSKGYTRRVGFAQSIIGNPDILLLDEPTDGLDPNQKDHMKKLIKDMSKNKTIIISTHLLDEAEAIATRIVLINKGKLVVDGDLNDILKKAKSSSFSQAFKILTTKEV